MLVTRLILPLALPTIRSAARGAIYQRVIGLCPIKNPNVCIWKWHTLGSSRGL